MRLTRLQKLKESREKRRKQQHQLLQKRRLLKPQKLSVFVKKRRKLLKPPLKPNEYALRKKRQLLLPLPQLLRLRLQLKQRLKECA